MLNIIVTFLFMLIAFMIGICLPTLGGAAFFFVVFTLIAFIIYALYELGVFS